MKVDIKTGYSIKQLLDELQGDILLTDHVLQRNAGQWKPKEKSLLIDSILRGVAIKPITVHLETADNDSRKWLLDGKQRLSVIQEFVGTKEKSGFALSRSIDPILAKMPKMVQETDANGEPLFEKNGRKKAPVMKQERDENGRLLYEMQEVKLAGKTFDKLPKALQDIFMNYKLMPVVELTNCTEEEVQRQIIRENISAKMNASQIGTVLSGEEIARFLKFYQYHALYLRQKQIRDSDRNKGLIERFVGESFVLMYEPDMWCGYEAMAKKFNSIMSKERIEEYQSLIDRLATVFNRVQETDARLYDTWLEPKNIYIIIKNFKAFVDLDVYPDAEYGKFLIKWFTEIKDHTEYPDFDVTSTKGKRSVLARCEIMEEEMVRYMECFGAVCDTAEAIDDEFIIEEAAEELKDFSMHFVSDEMAIQTLILTSDSPYSNFEAQTLAKEVQWYNEYGSEQLLVDCLSYKDLAIKTAYIDENDANLPFYVYAVKYISTNHISIDLSTWLCGFVNSAFAEIDENENNIPTSNSTIMLKESEIIKSISQYQKKEEETHEIYI